MKCIDFPNYSRKASKYTFYLSGVAVRVIIARDGCDAKDAFDGEWDMMVSQEIG